MCKGDSLLALSTPLGCLYGSGIKWLFTSCPAFVLPEPVLKSCIDHWRCELGPAAKFRIGSSQPGSAPTASSGPHSLIPSGRHMADVNHTAPCGFYFFRPAIFPQRLLCASTAAGAEEMTGMNQRETNVTRPVVKVCVWDWVISF